MPIVDKLDKVPADKIAEQLQTDAGPHRRAGRRSASALADDRHDRRVVRRRAYARWASAHPLLDEGLDGARARSSIGAAGADGVDVVADLRIARGLDYYTGTVFETRMAGYEHLGSICSGGRYDQLASDGKNTYPGVGISLGVSRLLVPLVADGLTADRSVPSTVLVALVDEDVAPGQRRGRLGAAGARHRRPRSRPRPQKFGKQIRYAETPGHPVCLVPRQRRRPHRSGTSASASRSTPIPTTWAPPAEDLKPHILSTPSKEQNT